MDIQIDENGKITESKELSPERVKVHLANLQGFKDACGSRKAVINRECDEDIAKYQIEIDAITATVLAGPKDISDIIFPPK